MLKVKDYEIKWSHHHFADKRHKMDGNPEKPEYRALTVCSIVDVVPTYGRTWCSWVDDFSYDTGRKISLKRAMKNAKLPKEERTLIWEAYRNMTNKPRW